MPDIRGHLYTAYRVEGPEVSSAFMLGAVLPDFEAMYHDNNGRPAIGRMGRRLAHIPAELERGMEFHQLTDKVFNSQPNFITAVSQLQTSLENHSVSPQAALLSAHLLGKMLTDRAVTQIPIEAAPVAQAAQIASEGLAVLEEITPENGLVEMVKGYFSAMDNRRRDIDYMMLAKLTQRRLDQRARTLIKSQKRTIKSYQREQTARAIEEVAEQVSCLGLAAIRDTVDDLILLRDQEP